NQWSSGKFGGGALLGMRRNEEQERGDDSREDIDGMVGLRQTQTIVFDSAWLTRNGLVSYQLDCSEENGRADADDSDPARHRLGGFRERLLRRSDRFVQALHVHRLAHSGCRRRALEGDHRITTVAPGIEAAGQ